MPDVDAECLRNPSGSSAEQQWIGNPAPLFHFCQAVDRLEGADQHGACGKAHEVQAPVDAIGTVDIGASSRPEIDPRFDPAVDTPEDGTPGPLLCVPIRLRGKVLGVARVFPKDPAAATARTGEVLAASLSAVVRNVLLYRSLLESIEDLARARRDAGGR